MCITDLVHTYLFYIFDLKCTVIIGEKVELSW
jgi:hypothetical protein